MASRALSSSDPKIWPVKQIVDTPVDGFKLSADTRHFAYESYITKTQISNLYTSNSYGFDQQKVGGNSKTLSPRLSYGSNGNSFGVSTSQKKPVYLDGMASRVLSIANLDGSQISNVTVPVPSDWKIDLGRGLIVPSNIVLSPDQQKILVHVDLGRKPDSGKKLLYIPLDGKPSYVINSPTLKSPIFLIRYF